MEIAVHGKPWHTSKMDKKKKGTVPFIAIYAADVLLSDITGDVPFIKLD